MSNLKKIRNIYCNVFLSIMLIFVAMFAFYGSSKINVSSEMQVKPIYNGNRNKNNVTLMINVYWGSEYIPDMLKVLETKNAKATFFIGGIWASKNPEVLMEIYSSGNELGNHGYFHKDHKSLSYEKNEEEIMLTHKLVKEYTGYDMNLFAPPSGAFGQTVLEVANTLGYKTIMWTRDTIDWRDKDADICYSRAIKNIAGGDLILMHPSAHTLEALPKIIDYCQSKNLIITTVTENIA